MKNRPFLLIGLIGLVIIAIVYFMEQTFPSSAPFMLKGFSKPITYYEFIQSPVEVEAFFGLDDYDFDSEKFIRDMNKGNKIDFLFAFVYSVFFFLFFKKLTQVSSKKWYKIGMILAVFAFIGDIVENIQLLQITSKLAEGGYENNLEWLFAFTWIKWWSLALGFALFGLWLVKLSGVLRYMGYVAWLPLILSFFALMQRGIYTELFTRSINIMFFVAISYCFMFEQADYELKMKNEE